jgi:hypothetical protein
VTYNELTYQHPSTPTVPVVLRGEVILVTYIGNTKLKKKQQQQQQHTNLA